MSEVQRLEAAIAKLEDLRVEGVWKGGSKFEVPAVVVIEQGLEIWVADVIDEAHRDLMVILHRTIAAQLVILRAAARAFEVHCLPSGDFTMPAEKAALELADAILGSES